MKLKYYKTDQGIFVSGHEPSNIGFPIINGVQSRKSFHSKWIIVDGISEIKRVEYKQPDLQINHRFIRKDDAPETLPIIIYRDEAPDYFESISHMYDCITDSVPQPNKVVEFESEFLGEFKMETLGDPTTFKFTMSSKGYSSGGHVEYDSIFNEYPWNDSNITVDSIIKSVAPEFAWHLYPCSISSDTSYRIIRHHVKHNINLKRAKITSDYDFCFTVRKLIPVKPWISKREKFNRSGKSYRPPRITERTETYREVDIFNMTPAERKYNGYPVIEGFKGESLEDLRLNIVNYLDELMEIINRPLDLCDKCEGKGYTEEIRSLCKERKK